MRGILFFAFFVITATVLAVMELLGLGLFDIQSWLSGWGMVE